MEIAPSSVVFNDDLFNRFNTTNDCGETNLLKNVGESCYQDSILVPLLYKPTRFVWDNILTKNIDNLNSISTGCDAGMLQDELKRITWSINSNEINNNTCHVRNLRDIIKKSGCAKDDEEMLFSSTRQGDLFTFMKFLFKIFNVDEQANILETYVKDLKTNTIGVEDHATYLLSLNGFANNKNPISSLINEHPDEREYYDGVHKRLKSYRVNDLNSNSPIFFGLTAIHKYMPNTFSPEQTIKIPLLQDESSSKSYKLSRIIIYIGTGKSGHYVCFLECGGYWYFYNDIGTVKPKLVGDYNSLINTYSNGLLRSAVLLMYIPTTSDVVSTPINNTVTTTTTTTTKEDDISYELLKRILEELGIEVNGDDLKVVLANNNNNVQLALNSILDKIVVDTDNKRVKLREMGFSDSEISDDILNKPVSEAIDVLIDRSSSASTPTPSPRLYSSPGPEEMAPRTPPSSSISSSTLTRTPEDIDVNRSSSTTPISVIPSPSPSIAESLPSSPTPPAPSLDDVMSSKPQLPPLPVVNNVSSTQTFKIKNKCDASDDNIRGISLNSLPSFNKALYNSSIGNGWIRSSKISTFIPFNDDESLESIEIDESLTENTSTTTSTTTTNIDEDDEDAVEEELEDILLSQDDETLPQNIIDTTRGLLRNTSLKTDSPEYITFLESVRRWYEINRPHSPLNNWNVVRDRITNLFTQSKIKKNTVKEFEKDVQKDDENDRYVPEDFGWVSAYAGTQQLNVTQLPKPTTSVVEIIEPQSENIAFKEGSNRKLIRVYSFIENIPIGTVVMVTTENNDTNKSTLDVSGVYLKIGRLTNDNRWIKLNNLNSDVSNYNEIWLKNIGKFIIPTIDIKKD